MNIEQSFDNAKVSLELAREKLDAGDIDTALSGLVLAYSNIRKIMELVWQMKRVEVLGPVSAGEDVT